MSPLFLGAPDAGALRSSQNYSMNPQKKNLILYCFEMLLMLFASQLANPLTSWMEAGIAKIIVRDIFLRIPIALIGFWWVYKNRFSQNSEHNISFSISYRLLLWLGIGFLPPLLVVAIYSLSGSILPPYLAFVPLDEASYFLIIAFVSACSASIIEEVLFRGYIYKVFERETSLISAITIPSFLFGIVHILTLKEFTPLNGLLITLGGTLIGIFFTLVVRLTRRLESAIALHFIWNFLFSKGLIAFYSETPDKAIDYLPLAFATDNPLITGGTASIQVGFPAILTYIISILIVIMVSYSKNAPNKACT